MCRKMKFLEPRASLLDYFNDDPVGGWSLIILTILLVALLILR